MASRRRIDWSVILGKDAPVPKWGANQAPSELLAQLLRFSDLFGINDSDAMIKRAVELALTEVGLVRAGIYLYDNQLDLMIGTWGTDLRRRVIDEHHSMFQSGEEGRRVFRRALSGEAHWTVVEDCPIINNAVEETRVVGRGWVVCTPIRSARGAIGMMYSDAGLTDAPINPQKQDHAALLCTLLALRIEGMRGTGRAPINPARRHPVIASAVRLLQEDPSLAGATIAKSLGVSLSRFARVFKTEMGVSLVEYRNQLRLERFMSLVDSGGSNLLEAALAAGFGSYSQFHRVFRMQRGKSPRQFFHGHG
jgi:AraC-like DNA-binding protein